MTVRLAARPAGPFTAPPAAAPQPLIGTRVRIRWPDGELTRSCGVITRLSPCKACPGVWPLAEACGYLPEIVNVTAWRASFAGFGQRFLREDGDHPRPPRRPVPTPSTPNPPKGNNREISPSVIRTVQADLLLVPAGIQPPHTSELHRRADSRRLGALGSPQNLRLAVILTAAGRFL
jgi:hypothetical protein